jgi:hypothetical protein
MQALDNLRSYINRYFWVPSCWNRKPNPGQVVMESPEWDREQFRKLKSSDIANFCDNQQAAWEAMPEDEKERYRRAESDRKLKIKFDQKMRR